MRNKETKIWLDQWQEQERTERDDLPEGYHGESEHPVEVLSGQDLDEYFKHQSGHEKSDGKFTKRLKDHSQQESLISQLKKERDKSKN